MGSHSYGITFIWDLIHIDVQPIAFGVSFLHSYGITFIWDHIHMGSHSYGISFIWDLIHMGSRSYRRTAYCIWSVISSFIWDHIDHLDETHGGSRSYVRYATHEWIMSHITESRLIRMSHERVSSHT